MTADLGAESRKIVLDNKDKINYLESSGISVNYVGINTDKGVFKR